jgi:YfiH family protein
MHFESVLLKKIPGLHHGFGTKSEPVPSSLEPFWTAAHPSWKQVHGIHFIEVSQNHQQCGETDGLVTFQKGIPVAVVTADCVPILLARKTGGAAAAIHAGWRGTYNGAVDEVTRFLRSKGEDLSNWVAAVGPAIGPCCFEVSEELVAQFQKRFSDPFSDPFSNLFVPLSSTLVSPSFRKLDLPAIHKARLQAEGYGAVDLIRGCTVCSRIQGEPTFQSYRREKNSARQYSGLVFTP